MPFDEARGARLKALVGSREIQEFCRQIDVSPGSLYSYFRGQPIGGIALRRLSEALDVPQEEIVNGPSEEVEADERSSQELLREILASQQELTATALRVERLLKDRREQERPDARRRSGSE